jgi:hypothetical protein
MNSFKKEKTQVLVLGTVHKFHKESNAYTYDDVFKIIDDFNPDIIGVEIRPEDMKQSREYLSKYYPYEMIEALFRWSKHIEVFGVDYYEKSVVVKLIPEGYFNNFYINEMQNKFEVDPLLTKERHALDICGNNRNEMINSNLTATELNDGRYDIICDIYYNQLESLLKKTPYEDMANFYKERDKHIDENIINIIEKNIDKKLMFVLGADHRGFAINAIKEKFNDTIELVRVK